MNATEQSLLHAFSKKSSTVEDQEIPIRPLNASSAEKPEIDVEIGGLFDIVKAEKSAVEKEPEAFRQAVGNILERRLFYNPSFDIYGGITGLLDYGPSGRLVELNVLSLWRKFFVNEEDMLEVGCSALTPEIVFNASGHVKKFTDLMVKDEVNGAFHRADHLVKGYCESRKKDVTISAEKAAELDNVLAVVEDLSAEELGAKIKEYGITAPHTKNPLSHPPRPFNLMFQTFFGPTGSSLGYLRPETAQGIFVNFMNYYNDNGRKLPLAVAQVGRVFRNEISPRQGPIRAREFLLAEIEHFVDPENKSHPKFPDVELLEFLMFPRDAEIECSYGWIECVGIADRSAYDLCAHSEKSGVSLVAEAKLAEPKEVEKLVITPVKKELGVAFKADQKNVVEALEAMNEQEAMEMKATLESKGEAEFEVCTLGKNVTIKKNMVSISKKRTQVRKRFFTPSVIEPSFGIGRIMYCLYEHCFSTRPSKAGDEQLNVFRFSPLVAPFKCTVLPLVQNQQLEEAAKVISKQLKSDGIKHKIEIAVASIGKRYARADELGVPFAITVDSPTSVTIRERDSRDQVRVSLKEVASVVTSMAEGKKTWQDVCARLNG